jgi:transcriptional regulator with XRE-family HTH domain
VSSLSKLIPPLNGLRRELADGTEPERFMSKQDPVDDEADVERGSRKPNPIDAHVGMRVRLRRMLLGMSQEKLGEHLGLTFQQVQKYEKGVNRIGASRLFDLARVLAVPIQFFYDEAPIGPVDAVASPGFAERPAESYVVDFLSTREGMELNKAFVKITDPKVRRSVVDLVRSLSGEVPGE